MFYKQLLRSQIPKVQKYTDDFTVILHFWDLLLESAWVKAADKSKGEIDPSCRSLLQLQAA